MVAWISTLVADLQAAWRGPRVPVLALPSDSRRHAQLRRDGERWLLRDLGSSNWVCYRLAAG